MEDWYLENKARLEGQPKRTIANYVEQNGIRVPRRFNSLAEARASGLPVFVRSEHPLEYAEISGFFDSFDLDYIEKNGKVANERELKQKVLIEGARASLDPAKEFHFLSHLILSNYCKLLGINPLTAMDDLSFSFWEELGGINMSVTADSSIKNRYHILDSFSNHNEDKSHLWSYNFFVVEDGKIVVKDVHGNIPTRQSFDNIIEFYESCRKLQHFDSNNCPIIEMQDFDNQLYFLQYHRGRQFNQADFELTRDLEKDELETMFVRGHTPKEGLSGEITVAYASEWMCKSYADWALPKEEFGSFDFHWNREFSNIMNPKRKLKVIYPSYEHNLSWELFKFSIHHSQLSELFNPEVSVIVDKNIFREPPEKNIMAYKDFDKTESYKLGKKAKETGINQGIPMRVISDGRRAFIKRLD